MGSSMGRRGPDLDTSQPGVRQLQGWIRGHTNLVVQLLEGTSVNGIPRWVDVDYLALQPQGATELVLINRSAIALIRPLV
jgi:host factor-I protein